MVQLFTNCTQKKKKQTIVCLFFFLIRHYAFSRLGLMSHFGALAAASSRYAALCGAPTDPRTLPWYWGRIPTQLSQDKSSPNGKKYNLNCSQITSFLYGFKKNVIT